MATPQKIARQVAFVSGAARGIGKAIALRLARDGFNVGVNDVKNNLPALEETAKEIKSLGRFRTGTVSAAH